MSFNKEATAPRLKGAKALLQAVGIQLNGSSDCDIQIHDEARFYKALFSGSTLQIGEAFMMGVWDVKDLAEVICRVLQTAAEGLKVKVSFATIVTVLWYWLLNKLVPSKLAGEAARHYNTDQELFRHQLGSTQAYSCAYYGRAAKDLDSAQRAKFRLICEKLQLKPGMRVLDIGCGWGTLAVYMARHYGVSVVGITVSQDQYEDAVRNCAGLDIEIRLQDYIHLNGEQFDRIVSVGMFEHIRSENYRKYFRVVSRCLKEDGIFLLHTIGCLVTKRAMDPWIDKHIFPASQLPCLFQITKAIERLFVPEDIHNFGADYDRTLMAWWANFDAGWPQIRHRFGDPASQTRFYRKWKFYLHSCAGAFRARNLQLYQIVLTKRGTPGGYESVR